MSVKVRFSLVTVFLAVVSLSIGCGSSNLPDVGTVSGRITLDGQPLGSAKVTFASDHSRSSYGQTDADGNYELVYIRDVKGAAIGSHTVSITTGGLAESTEPAPEPSTDGGLVPGPETTIIPETVPAKYNTETTLTVDVKAGENTFNFDLESSK